MGRNRWFQLVASVIAMLMIANLQYSWNLFTEPIRKSMGWKLSDIQWAFTLFVLFQTWTQPMQGWAIDRIGPRFLITLAGVLCGIGWTAMAYADTLTKLYVFYAIAGAGAAFVYSGCIAAALKWFPDRRGFASGLIAAGFGGGSFFFIPPVSYIINHYSYGSAFITTGVIQGIIIILAAQVLRNPPAEFIAVKATAAGSKAAAPKQSEQFSTLEMLSTPRFYVLYTMFVMAAAGGLQLTANAGALAKEWGISAAMLTAAVALFPAANGASRIFWGWASDKIGRETSMFIAFTAQAACLLGILFVGRLSGFLFAVSLVLISFTWGEIYSLFPATVGDYFGARNAASNYSFVYTAKGVASFGAPLAALVAERFGSWSSTFYVSAFLALISGILAFVLRTLPLPKKAYAEAGEVRMARS